MTAALRIMTLLYVILLTMYYQKFSPTENIPQYSTQIIEELLPMRSLLMLPPSCKTHQAIVVKLFQISHFPSVLP